MAADLIAARAEPLGRWTLYDGRAADWLSMANLLCDGICDSRARDNARQVACEIPRYVDREHMTRDGCAVAAFTGEQIAVEVGFKKRQTVYKALSNLERLRLIERMDQGRRGRPSTYALNGWVVQ